MAIAGFVLIRTAGIGLYALVVKSLELVGIVVLSILEFYPEGINYA